MAFQQIVRRTTAEWADNLTLLPNQIGVASNIINGVETDTLICKLGNGIDNWSALPIGNPFNSTALISDTAYDATTWNGVTTIAPSKNAVRDRLEAVAFTTLTDAATVVWAISGSASQNATVTLTASRTLSITGATSGASGTLQVIQGGAGSWTLTLPAGSKVVGGGTGAITLTATAGAIDVISFLYDGTSYLFTYGLNFT